MIFQRGEEYFFLNPDGLEFGPFNSVDMAEAMVVVEARHFWKRIEQGVISSDLIKQVDWVLIALHDVEATIDEAAESERASYNSTVSRLVAAGVITKPEYKISGARTGRMSTGVLSNAPHQEVPLPRGRDARLSDSQARASAELLHTLQPVVLCAHRWTEILPHLPNIKRALVMARDRSGLHGADKAYWGHELKAVTDAESAQPIPETVTIPAEVVEETMTPVHVAKLRTIKELAQEALDVQDACNLSGVVHGFSRMMTDLCRLEPELGTDARNTHPICILWADKIAHLTNTQVDNTKRVFDAYAAVNKIVGKK